MEVTALGEHLHSGTEGGSRRKRFLYQDRGGSSFRKRGRCREEALVIRKGGQKIGGFWCSGRGVVGIRAQKTRRERDFSSAQGGGLGGFFLST